MYSPASFSVSSFRPSGKMIGSSNEADQDNRNTQAMILGVPRQHSLFLVACHLVHVLYYREMKTKREWRSCSGGFVFTTSSGAVPRGSSVQSRG
jgi:hypothetical protein